VGVTTAEANSSGRPPSPRNWRRGQELTGGRRAVTVLHRRQPFYDAPPPWSTWGCTGRHPPFHTVVAVCGAVARKRREAATTTTPSRRPCWPRGPTPPAAPLLLPRCVLLLSMLLPYVCGFSFLLVGDPVLHCITV